MTFGWPQTFSLTTADVTFELSVDKGRSEAASPGYTPTHTIDMAQWAVGYFGQMSPSLHHDNLPPDSQEVRVHREVLASLWFSSEPCSIKTLHTLLRV